MGFNCVGILYNKNQLEVVSSTEAPESVGYDKTIPGRDVNTIGKFFPPDVKPLCLGTTSDKEDRFMGAWLFNRINIQGIDKVILASGNWPNEKDGLVAQQKAANGITIAGLPDPTADHFQALLRHRKKFGDIPIIFGFDFNNEYQYVMDNMRNFCKGTDVCPMVQVSEDQPTCCPDIVRNHGPEIVIPKKDKPGEYDFKPRKDPFQ